MTEAEKRVLDAAEELLIVLREPRHERRSAEENLVLAVIQMQVEREAAKRKERASLMVDQAFQDVAAGNEDVLKLSDLVAPMMRDTARRMFDLLEAERLKEQGDD